MKRALLVAASLLVIQHAHSQITITAADMPMHGDKLIYSNADMTVAGINPGDSGANMMWNYNLVPTSQGMDEYKYAYQVSNSFASTISVTAIGYKVADSIPGLSSILGMVSPIPVNITDIHTFFDHFTNPRPAFVATAYTYKLSILSTAENYTQPDVWYFFPLTYGNAADSTPYELHLSLMSFLSIHQYGNRTTRVDGWGTITTPYFTTPVPCIRVRTVIREIDSIELQGNKFGVPRDMVEYKWLANGEHYPALWVTSTLLGGNETVTQIRYRDAGDPIKVATETPAIFEVKAYPNPAANGIAKLELPADFKTYAAEVFDVTGKLVTTTSNTCDLDLSAQPSGRYLIRVTSGVKVGYATVVR